MLSFERQIPLILVTFSLFFLSLLMLLVAYLRRLYLVRSWKLMGVFSPRSSIVLAIIVMFIFWALLFVYGIREIVRPNSACGYPVSQHHTWKRLLCLHWIASAPLSESNWTQRWGCIFWTLSSSPLISTSTVRPVPALLDYWTEFWNWAVWVLHLCSFI